MISHDKWEEQSFNEIIRDKIFDWLDDNEGVSVYGGELASEITMDDNNDGAFILYKKNAENFIKKFWDEASETYDDHVANFGKSDSFIPNPFSDPEKYTFFMEDWGVNNIISQVELVNDNWNDEMELTPEIIGCIKNQINDLPEFNKTKAQSL